MAKFNILRGNSDSTAWKCAFADSLIGACPDMNPDAVDEVSDTELLRDKDRDPIVAAQRWAKRQTVPATPPKAANIG